MHLETVMYGTEIQGMEFPIYSMLVHIGAFLILGIWIRHAYLTFARFCQARIDFTTLNLDCRHQFLFI